MYVYRNFARTALALLLLGLAASAHAGIVVLTNLDEPARLSSMNPYVGQSFIAGNSDQTLFGAEMQLNAAAPPSSSIMLEVEARNSNGTVGQTLFDKFSYSYDKNSGRITFMATSDFVLKAGTGYWLVLHDAPKGGVNWDFTPMNVYKSDYGYGLPSFDTSWTSNIDHGGGNSRYFQPSDGPQMFALVTFGSSVPEPASIIQGSLAALLIGFLSWYTHARSRQSGRARSAIRR
jgi:hypothetical protein